MKKLSLIILISWIGIITPIKAQEPGKGGHPADIRWKYLNTQAVKIIYPETIDSTAQKVANYINHIYLNQYYSIGFQRRKLHLVLQNNQVQSNGYVALAPFKSEFFLTPPQDKNMLGSMDWATSLSIHEYRHALQFSNTNKSIGMIGYLLGGDGGLSTISALIVPNWFFEGDAVLSETVLTDQGRGYLPSFFNEQKALLINDIHYSYQKARNGSYKDLLPNHYPLGYAMVRKAREVANNGDVWNDILNKAMALHGIVYPFSQSIRKYTNLTSTHLYEAAYSDMQEKWKEQLDTIQLSTSENIITKDHPFVSSYINLTHSDQHLYALMNSYSKTPQIVEIKEGKPHKVLSVNHLTSAQFAVNKNTIVWAQSQSDPFYQYRTYSNIFKFDIETNTKTKLTTKGKYFAPSLSPDNRQIVASEFTPNQESKIVIIDSQTGERIHTLTPFKNGQVSFPKWDKKGDAIIYICSYNNLVTLVKQSIDGSQDSYTILTPPSNHVISNFDMTDKEIFFSASYSGIDNIYKTSLDGEQMISQVTSVKVGAYHPTIDKENHKLYYSEFTTKGQKPMFCDADIITNKKIEVTNLKDKSIFPILKGQQEENILSHNDDKKYYSAPYDGFLSDIRLHSWGSVNVNNHSGLGVRLDDNLNNLSLGLAYSQNNISEQYQYDIGLTYGKYPVKIKASYSRVSKTNNGDDLFVNQTKSMDDMFAPLVDRTRLNLSLPLQSNSTNYHYSAQVDLGIGSYRYKIRDLSNYTLEQQLFGSQRTYSELDRLFPEISTKGIEYRADITLSAMRRKAYTQLQPKLGCYFHLGYILEEEEETPTFNFNGDGQWNIESRIYLPGFMNNDGFYVDGAYAKNDNLSLYSLKSTSFLEARGIRNLITQQRYSLRNNYQFPIVYPDFGIASIVYFKRIRANLFYDMQWMKDLLNYPYEEQVTRTYASFGAEITLDINWINTLPIPVGLRYGKAIHSEYARYKQNPFFEIFTAITL